MSNELTIQDPNALALREEMNRRVDDRVRQLELADRSGASVGNTILTVRRRGGIGASTLNLSLEYLLKRPLLHIEIEGAPCSALKGRGADDYLHFPSSDPNRIDDALNARLQYASRLAILEFEPALYQRTLEIAAALKLQVSPSNVVIFYIAGKHDPYPKYAANAHNRGMNQVYLCRQATQSYEEDPDGLIKLPWIDDDTVSNMMRNGLSLEDALKQSNALWTANMTKVSLEAFGSALWRAEQ